MQTWAYRSSESEIVSVILIAYREFLGNGRHSLISNTGLGWGLLGFQKGKHFAGGWTGNQGGE
jgi:hypothetical protein